MKKLKSIEKLMTLTSRKADAELDCAYNKMVTVFRFIDRKEHSNHCKIIDILYNAKNKNFTLLGVANLMHTSDNALRRYRSDYADWFCYYLEIGQQNG